MARYTPDDWQERLVSLLIQAGTDGVPERELNKFCTPTSVVTDLLEELLTTEAVQRFRYTPKGKLHAITIWRATTKIWKSRFV